MWPLISALCWFSASCGLCHQPLWRHLCVIKGGCRVWLVLSPAWLSVTMTRNSAWLFIPSVILAVLHCLGVALEKKEIFVAWQKGLKTLPKSSSYFWLLIIWERGEGEKEELEIIVCNAHTRKVFLFLSCLINRQNFTPCRCSSSVLPPFCRLLPLGSFKIIFIYLYCDLVTWNQMNIAVGLTESLLKTALSLCWFFNTDLIFFSIPTWRGKQAECQ